MPFLANFTKLCNSVRKSPTAVCDEIGLSNAAYSYWKKSGRAPSTKTLQKIADYFKIEVDKLFEEDVPVEEHKPEPEPESKEGTKLIRDSGPRKTTLIRDSGPRERAESFSLSRKEKEKLFNDSLERELLSLFRHATREAKIYVFEILERSVQMHPSKDDGKFYIVVSEKQPQIQGKTVSFEMVTAVDTDGEPVVAQKKGDE